MALISACLPAESRPARFCRSGGLRLMLALLALFFVPGWPGAAEARGNTKYASIVMDADTGMILRQRNADKSLHPASLTKIMTLVLAFEAIENGELSLRDRVVISRHAADMIPSKLGLPVGSSIRVEDAIYALITKSANDVAVALAEKIGGTESNFARYMTVRAHQIGMSRTRFRNASGLHHPKQVSTARDMARLAQYVLNTYPQYYHYFSTKRFSYRGKTYRNHNRLMESYSGMDGFKTGYIRASGFNLVASAKRNDRRIIGVVFGGRTAKTRNAHMQKILDEGFSKLGRMMIARAAPIPPRKPAGLTRLASLSPAAGIEEFGRWADLNPILQSQAFSALIGEGDYDPAETRRLETGLMAIAAVKGFEQSPPPVRQAVAARPAVVKTPSYYDNWSIQVGAFSSRVKTDNVIRTAQRALPRELAGAKPVIVPLKTGTGWLFRGRLSGYSKQQAERACAILKECLTISPQAH